MWQHALQRQELALLRYLGNMKRRTMHMRQLVPPCMRKGRPLGGEYIAAHAQLPAQEHGGGQRFERPMTHLSLLEEELVGRKEPPAAAASTAAGDH